MRLRLPTPSRRAINIGLWVVVLMIVAVIALLVIALLRVTADTHELDARADAGRADRAALRADLGDQQAALSEANRRLKAVGEKPVSAPVSPVVAMQGAQGDRGPGPTASQIRAALLDFCGITCRGEDGKDSRVPGPPGADSTVPGPTGATGPQGEPGKDGRDGVDGKDGVDGAPGQSAYPFTFVFTVPNNPAQSTTYTVTCTTPGEPCTVVNN